MHAGQGAYSVLWLIIKSLLTIGGIILAAKILFPWVMEKMVATRIRESFTLTIILFCLGTAWLTSKMGLSLALGAFIAGLIVSESEYSHQAISEIIPLTDSFTGLFFISVGMLLDLRFVYKNIFSVIILVGIILVVKGVVLLFVIGIIRRNLRIAILIGLGLAQIGEFSFILAQVGLRYGLISQSHYQHFLASSILTMLGSPFLIHSALGLAFRVQTLLSKWFQKEIETEGFTCPLTGHTLIIGYGLNGRNLARVLKEAGLPYQIVDLNAENVRQGKEDGHPIYFGDATKKEILDRLSTDCAMIAVVAISDPSATRRIVWQTRKMNPNIYIIARTRFVSEVEELYKIGADQVIPEEFETSVEIFSHVLHRYRIPRNVINLHVDSIRNSGYGMLRGLNIPDERFENIQKIISQSLTETFMIMRESMAVEKSLAELDLRAKTGVTIIGIIRDDRSIVNPEPGLKVKAGDILIMFGDHQKLDKAIELLSPPKKDDKS
jgi:CPA2 family monovalent cation:H+ antiporter-2